MPPTIPASASRSRSAMTMWPNTLMPTNSANQPCTKSAPVRRSVEKGWFHFMIEPVAARTTAAAPMNVALSF